jgi:Lamin Tail Domain
MIFINEWLPNPTGADARGEFIELWNNGNVPVNLSGWILQTDNKKKFKLSGSLRANGYLVLPRSETKLALKNTDGAVFLYDPAGKLADRSAFVGSAPEGESFNRASYNTYDHSSADNAVQQFIWGKPTPGAKNNISGEIGISEIKYPTGVALNGFGASWLSVFGCAACVGMIFTAILWYAIKNDFEVSQLFFG